MMNTRKIRKGLSFTLKLLIGILIVSPIILGFTMSFMTAAELASVPPHILPVNPVIRNYQKALKAVPLFGFLLNSMIVSAIVITGQVITCSMAAYAFAFYNFKGKRWVFMAVLATMMIPADATIIANYLTISSLKLIDTYVALVAPYLTSAMGIFLMRQFYMTIPKELREASLIDGCGDLRFLFNIVVPISIPAIASLGVYVFIQTYNQFLWPLLVTNTANMRTVQIGISMLQSAEVIDYGVVLAGAVVILVPAICVFVIGQKYLIRGMTSGAVKG